MDNGGNMETKDKYNNVAKKYDKIEEKLPINKFRLECIKELKGEILEVGIGSGGNMKFYPKEKKIIGIDFSSKMLEIANEKKIKYNLNNVELREMNIEKMDFPDESFDSVLATGVFCTIPNPKKGMDEIYRVLKKGGKAVFLEHMKSKNKFKNAVMKLLEPVFFRVLGDNLLRETEAEVRKNKFLEVQSRNVMLGDVVRIIIATK